MTENIDHLRAALCGTIPCDGCCHRQRCKTEALACNDFNHWVNTGRLRESPNRTPVKIRAVKSA